MLQLQQLLRQSVDDRVGVPSLLLSQHVQTPGQALCFIVLFFGMPGGEAILISLTLLGCASTIFTLCCLPFHGENICTEPREEEQEE